MKSWLTSKSNKLKAFRLTLAVPRSLIHSNRSMRHLLRLDIKESFSCWQMVLLAIQRMFSRRSRTMQIMVGSILLVSELELQQSLLMAPLKQEEALLSLSTITSPHLIKLSTCSSILWNLLLPTSSLNLANLDPPLPASPILLTSS